MRNIENFLKKELSLKLHPDKVTIRKFSQGVDFLGYVVLPYYTVLRTKTKKRIFKKLSKRYEDLQKELISEESFNQSLQSYLGILKHCQGYGMVRKIEQIFDVCNE